ncbi:MAG: hypothetical protein WC765_02515 [Phycisphaerae bacterium]
MKEIYMSQKFGSVGILQKLRLPLGIAAIAFFIIEKLFRLPYGDLLAIAGIVAFLFVSSLAIGASVHGLRSVGTWIFTIVFSTMPVWGIYLVNILFPEALSPPHGSGWAYFMAGVFLFSGFWYLKMDKKMMIRRSTWIAFYLCGLMLVTINIGISVQENKVLPYTLLSALVLIGMIVVCLVRYSRSKKEKESIRSSAN